MKGRYLLRARIGNLWNNVRDSLWFIPTLMVVGAVALAALLLFVDSDVLDDPDRSALWLFGGSASAARSLLSTVAGSLITVISVAFSITIIALQQASTQYTPRILRNFMADRSNQVVLGTYIATFTYSLVVMRQVRGDDAMTDEFVPALSVSAAILLALLSLAALVYFIHHISSSLQVSTILHTIRHEVEREIEHLFPGHFQPGSSTPATMEDLIGYTEKDRQGDKTSIRSHSTGYLRVVDEDQLFGMAHSAIRMIWVVAGAGAYVQKDSVLAQVWADEPLSEETQEKMRQAFVLDRERTIRQDPLFGIRQIVDMAVKALSPSINDPTTAEQCLNTLGSILATVARKEFPSMLERSENGTRFLMDRPDFSGYVDVCLSQIRRANDMVHVTIHLLEMIIQLSQHIPSPERAAPLEIQVNEILAKLDSQGYSETDKQQIRDRCAATLRALSVRPQELQEAA
jgi:uncharacterized membrane protein